MFGPAKLEDWSEALLQHSFGVRGPITPFEDAQADALEMMDIVSAYERAVALLIAPGSDDAADWARLTARHFLSEPVDVARSRDLAVKYEPSDEQMDEQFAAIQREREAAKLEANAGVIWIEE